MKFYADLHIHSRFSRATSKDLTIRNLEKWGKVKGLNLIGTGDFTHPEWIKELKLNLEEDGTGILKSKRGMKFVLQTEVSLIYTQDGRGRRVHLVILAPNFDTVDKITQYLLTKGRIDYDGRPIFKIPAYEFVYEMQKIDKDIEVIPAHIWTPWFGLLGEKSGFDSIKQAFKDQTKYIHAIETGLSSDPPMNWRVKELDKLQLISNSDSHSFWPWRMGREANILELKELTYKNLLEAIRIGKGLTGTIEVDPNYGKYYFTGHRGCGISMSPEEAKKLNNICPVCGKKLTIGVLERVEEIADRAEGEKPNNTKPFYSLIPLSELISTVVGKAVTTKTVWAIFNQFLAIFRNELNVLLEAPYEELAKVDPKIADIIIKNRKGEIKVKPGYDGVYGVPLIGDVVEDKTVSSVDFRIKRVQKGLDEF
jgi:uncharacterized protein (TIGR00375 family)